MTKSMRSRATTHDLAFTRWSFSGWSTVSVLNPACWHQNCSASANHRFFCNWMPPASPSTKASVTGRFRSAIASILVAETKSGGKVEIQDIQQAERQENITV